MVENGLKDTAILVLVLSFWKRLLSSATAKLQIDNWSRVVISVISLTRHLFVSVGR